MTEFWESSFRQKGEMWGFEPADSAFYTLGLFKKYGFNKILIPGLAYGRNAKIFTDAGFKVSGIEISDTAIDLAKKYIGKSIRLYHGSVISMPFDKELYDGIFCYALIHLLNENERIKLICDCYEQLKPGGYMVFVALSTSDTRFGEGKKIRKDTFKSKHGVSLFFYDADSVEKEFGTYGLIESYEILDPPKNSANKPSQIFWQILCKKEAV